MIAKTFEVRDSGTFIPVMAVKMEPGNEADRYLMARAGFGRTPEEQAGYVTLLRIAGGVGTATSDPHEWPGNSRTIPWAHRHIYENWDKLESGAVVDVEFILGETPQPKRSERETS